MSGMTLLREPVPAIEPFVGRTRELAQLDAARAALLQGRGHLLVVDGEAGIGKSRFCAEVAERVREAGARVVMARCWLDGGAPPLWPWQPILAELCGDDAVKLLTSTADVADVGPDRFARFVAVTGRLADACRQSPVCLVIDDVHGTDVGALLLIRFVARSLPRFPLLVLLSRRSGEPVEGSEEARLLDELEREATAITLGGLDIAETEAFLHEHGVPHVAPDMLTTLFGLTRGHPLFLRRIAQTMSRSGAEPALRGGLQVAIEQALDGLGAASRHVLSVAAVLGPDPLVSETAEVAGCSTVDVLDTIDDGAAAGLVAMAGDGRLSFSHELVRAAMEHRLSPADRVEAHARAAAVVADDAIAGPRAHRLARAAYHARCAASRSADDARRAVSLCEAAAQAMVGNYAYEQADALLSAAMDLHALGRLSEPSAWLTLQWAEAAALRGHMRAALERYGAALTRAEAEDKPALLAEAALGWGGVWLGTHSTPFERARSPGFCRKALDRLPATDPAHETLRTRLQVRLTAEATFGGGPMEPLFEAVEAARRSGDPRALAEALNLAHHAMFTPEHVRGRLALAEELVEVTSVADLEVLSLMGMLWRTIDILHLGAEPCIRALEALRERATALGNESVLYNVAVVDVLLLVGQGRLADAEAQAHRAHELGERIDQLDRHVYRATQIAAIRWMQGREGEAVATAEEVTTSPTLSDREFSVWAMAACLAARAGDRERAWVILKRCLPSELVDLAPSGTWTAGLVALVEAAVALGDRGLSGQAYDLLLPHADLPAVAGLGIVCLGSVERTLGVAAAALGRHDLAVEHLERAVAANERLGNRPMATISRGDLAGALVRRGDAPGSRRDRASALLRQVITEGSAMELTGRVAGWEAELRDLDAARPASDPAAVAAPGGRREDRRAASGTGSAERGVIRRDGRRWIVALVERRIRVPHRVGMRYLAELLTNPGKRIPAVTLADNVSDPSRPQRHELLDEQARSTYAARARELAADLAEAEASNDLHRAERLRVELDALVDQLEAATGLNGRPRHFPDDHERARVAVQKAIKRAIEAIEDADTQLADTFRQTISTGVTCSYTPLATEPIAWSTQEPEDSEPTVR